MFQFIVMGCLTWITVLLMAQPLFVVPFALLWFALDYRIHVTYNRRYIAGDDFKPVVAALLEFMNITTNDMVNWRWWMFAVSLLHVAHCFYLETSATTLTLGLSLLLVIGRMSEIMQLIYKSSQLNQVADRKG